MCLLPITVFALSVYACLNYSAFKPKFEDLKVTEETVTDNSGADETEREATNPPKDKEDKDAEEQKDRNDDKYKDGQTNNNNKKKCINLKTYNLIQKICQSISTEGEMTEEKDTEEEGKVQDKDDKTNNVKVTERTDTVNSGADEKVGKVTEPSKGKEEKDTEEKKDYTKVKDKDGQTNNVKDTEENSTVNIDADEKVWKVTEPSKGKEEKDTEEKEDKVKDKDGQTNNVKDIEKMGTVNISGGGPDETNQHVSGNEISNGSSDLGSTIPGQPDINLETTTGNDNSIIRLKPKPQNLDNDDEYDE